MKQQLLKPWLIIALAFLLVSGVIIRIVEYQLPTTARRAYSEVGDRYETLMREKKLQPVPNGENALPVYEEAVQLMYETWTQYPEKEGYFFEWKIEANPANYHLYDYKEYVLPLPSQPFPEELRARIRRCVDAYQPVLNKLHHAATLTIPETLWEPEISNLPNDTAYRRSLWRMRDLLHFEILLCILDNNEAGAMKAFHTLRALKRAHSNNVFFSFFGRDRGYISCREITELLYFGMEHNVFSEHSLKTLQELLATPHEVTTEDNVRELFMNQKQQEFYRRDVEERLSLQDMLMNSPLAPCLYDSWRWYKDRMRVQGATGRLAAIQAQQSYLLGTASEPVKALMSRFDSEWSAGSMEVRDPFGRYDFFEMSHLYYYANYSRSYDSWMERFHFLRIIIALGRYRLEHGAFPQDIHAINGYVAKKDLDIFTNQDFLYERTDTGWIIRQNRMPKNNHYKRPYAYPLGTVVDGKEFLIQ